MIMEKDFIFSMVTDLILPKLFIPIQNQDNNCFLEANGRDQGGKRKRKTGTQRSEGPQGRSVLDRAGQ